MSAKGRPHQHHADEGEQGPDWFRALDIIVWVAVAVIAAVGIEWFVGYLTREKIAAGASRYLDRVRTAKGEETSE